jgi:nucleotide-binding universal stress UspA family protein
MKDVEKILVPVDFSPNAAKVLDAARYVAGKCAARLFVLFVVQSFDDYSGFFVPHIPIAQFEGEMLAGARKKLDAFLDENLPEDESVTSDVAIGEVAVEIVEYARKEDCDLIVMGTHGYKGLESVLFGSVAAKVVRNAHCPVLTVNPYR